MGAYSNNSVIQTGTNGGKNVSVVSSNGQGIVSQVYQQADGAGSMNDMKLNQAGNNSYTGSQQNATAGGKNKVDLIQTGYDAPLGNGSYAIIIQNADGAGSMNTLKGEQNIAGAEGIFTLDLTQTAIAGGVNEGTLNQSGTYAIAGLDQLADGAGSKNTATFNQSGTDQFPATISEAAILQTAFTGGTNNATVNQSGTEQAATLEQVAATSGTNKTVVTQSDDQHVANIFQFAGNGGNNDAKIVQAMDGFGLSGSMANVEQEAVGVGSKNTADITQYGGDPGPGLLGTQEVAIEQIARGGGENVAVVPALLPLDKYI